MMVVRVILATLLQSHTPRQIPYRHSQVPRHHCPSNQCQALDHHHLHQKRNINMCEEEGQLLEEGRAPTLVIVIVEGGGSQYTSKQIQIERIGISISFSFASTEATFHFVFQEAGIWQTNVRGGTFKRVPKLQFTDAPRRAWL